MRRTHCKLVALGFLLGVGGCEGFSGPPPGADWQGTSATEGRRSITDPKLRAVAEDWQTGVLKQQAADGQPVFSRAELLPITMTALPYGVGAYEQQPRLPVILTTGPGWSALRAEQKEQQIALAYKDLADRLEKAGLGKDARPTLTLQTPQGMLLAWMNDLPSAGKRIHGDND
jgi:hypothetical protein